VSVRRCGGRKKGSARAQKSAQPADLPVDDDDHLLETRCILTLPLMMTIAMKVIDDDDETTTPSFDDDSICPSDDDDTHLIYRATTTIYLTTTTHLYLLT
jgi:hypothetical protein